MTQGELQINKEGGFPNPQQYRMILAGRETPIKI